MQPGAETATARDGGGATVTNGDHQEDGAGATSDMAATGDEESRGRGGEGEELGHGGGGGNRWPRQETVALLKIRSDMDAVFRDSGHKGPLWEDVSRKMAEMGYCRSAKKCKEKFENVYKYHKRTKEGRAAKADGKTYRFFDQLEAFDANHPSSSLFSSRFPSSPVEAAIPLAMAMPPPRTPPPPSQPPVTVSSTTQPPFQQVTPAIHHIPRPVQPPQNANPMNFPSSLLGTPTSSFSTSSDDEVTGRRKKRKRKWKEFFERLTKDVMEKQEELQRKFLEAIQKRDNERRVREEAWKVQEMARLKREHDVLVQERSVAAAKDAALVSFLQKLSEKQQIPLPPAITQSPPQPPYQPPPQPHTPTIPAPIPVATGPATTQLQHNVETMRSNNGDPTAASSSRWPKPEVEALIKLRTSLDHKYEESAPKGPLWEEISAAMRRLGYNRNAKRCKEKWENINKYFKRMKESNKKRREDSKTCPYYHQLEALYREKNSLGAAKTHQPVAAGAAGAEKQCPIQPPPQEKDPRSDDVDLDEEEYDDEEEDDDQGGEYEIVANSSNAAAMGGSTGAVENS